jgi:hypothetical protein
MGKQVLQLDACIQVRLYDESENLIESKFPSKADLIECGKSFTMDSHLVDIGDPMHLLSNPTATSTAQQNGNRRLLLQLVVSSKDYNM